MNTKELINRFYESFKNGDVEGMVSCYHADIRFEDPAFGVLQGNDAKTMWRMLIERSKGEIKLEYKNVQADDKTGRAEWVAEYLFSQTKRKVVNRISSAFEFKDDKIIRHTDTFDLHKWAGQALGWKGYLLGWTSFMQGKIQERSRHLLEKYKVTTQ